MLPNNEKINMGKVSLEKSGTRKLSVLYRERGERSLGINLVYLLTHEHRSHYGHNDENAKKLHTISYTMHLHCQQKKI